MGRHPVVTWLAGKAHGIGSRATGCKGVTAGVLYCGKAPKERELMGLELVMGRGTHAERAAAGDFKEAARAPTAA